MRNIVNGRTFRSRIRMTLTEKPYHIFLFKKPNGNKWRQKHIDHHTDQHTIYSAFLD